MVVFLGGRCFDCKRKFPQVCFHFDHRDLKQKEFNIGANLRKKIEVLKAEVLKCDLVCANCHAIRTHKNYEVITKKISKGWKKLRGKFTGRRGAGDSPRIPNWAWKKNT